MRTSLRGVDMAARKKMIGIRLASIAQMKRSPTHPGQVLLEEFLKPKNLTQMDVTRATGMATNRVNELVNRKRGVTPETAILLSRWTGAAPEFWMQLQANYDLWHAMQRLKRVAVKQVAPGAAFPARRGRAPKFAVG